MAPGRGHRVSRDLPLALYVGLIVAYLGIGAMLVSASGVDHLWDAVTWYDPLFFQYNLVLLLLSVLIVPIMTLIYVMTRKEEKTRRLKTELPRDAWEAGKGDIEALIERQFSLTHFLGSTITLMLVVTLGSTILLVVKPQFQAPGDEASKAAGVGFFRGGNFLLMGPYIESLQQGGGSQENLSSAERLLTSLTAFQFGFLGAYVFFLGYMVRSYFTMDLTPSTYVDSIIRMITASLLALVLSFPLPSLFPTKAAFFGFLPLVSFFIGMFPSRGLAFMDELVSATLQKMRKARYASASLSKLPGMSYFHEARLVREGFDNVENLSQANPLELAIRTGLSHRQVSRWVDQARLAVHLGDEYEQVRLLTGITGASELVRLMDKAQSETDHQPFEALRLDEEGRRIIAKLRIVSALLR